MIYIHSVIYTLEDKEIEVRTKAIDKCAFCAERDYCADITMDTFIERILSPLIFGKMNN